MRYQHHTIAGSILGHAAAFHLVMHESAAPLRRAIVLIGGATSQQVYQRNCAERPVKLERVFETLGEQMTGMGLVVIPGPRIGHAQPDFAMRLQTFFFAEVLPRVVNEVGGLELGFIGHSYGAFMGMHLLANTKPTAVLVALGGVGLLEAYRALHPEHAGFKIMVGTHDPALASSRVCAEALGGEVVLEEIAGCGHAFEDYLTTGAVEHAMRFCLVHKAYPTQPTPARDLR
ncbi:MAG: hypothetical protein AAFX99_12745 [Myxococcota bacterium]